MSLTHTIIIDSWTEYERGWGCRPDGYSVHANQQEYTKFLKEYWDRQPKDHVPYEYSKEDGNPIEVQVTEEVYNKVVAKGNGCFCWNTKDLETFIERKLDRRI
jgi:hypothetical protein